MFTLKLLIWTICLKHFDGWPIGQKVERIPEEDGLETGDGLHPDDVGHRLRPVPDDSRVGDSQTVEQVHQDHHWLDGWLLEGFQLLENLFFFQS